MTRMTYLLSLAEMSFRLHNCVTHVLLAQLSSWNVLIRQDWFTVTVGAAREWYRHAANISL